MDTNREKIDELTRRINELAQQQTHLSRQLVQLISELEILKQQVAAAPAEQNIQPVKETVIEFQKPVEAPVHRTVPKQVIVKKPAPIPVGNKKVTTFEEFVGKNLASKVGILVTIVGIFIGAKYAIEHNMISPVVRIICGYISGGVLIALAARLKKKYEAYSAVLMGGGIAVLYFITYIAYSFYNLLPQWASFGLMLIFTVATVYVALIYNRVIIAHLGLTGAYAIPFLLSDNSGRYEVLFSYIAIINAGILVLSFRKYWKSLFHTAFIATWLIYSVWIAFTYDTDYFNLAITFLSIYFLTFYATFLAYKLIKKEQYGFGDVAVLLSNSFIFYGFGYGLLSGNESTENYAGLFTLVNAAIHLTVSQVIRRLQLADRALYFFVLGLVIVFLTIAIPVQLDGNWVTLLWTAEAVLVFIIGRTRKAAAYEKLGTGLIALGFFSLIHDWFSYYVIEGNDKNVFSNIIFVSGILVLAAQGVIIYFNRSKKYVPVQAKVNFVSIFYDYMLPVLFLVTGYLVFQLEISSYFRQVNEHIHGADGSFTAWRGEVNAFAFATYLLYSMVFVSVIALVNQRWIPNKQLGAGILIGTTFILLILMLVGLVTINRLAENYFRRDGIGLYFGKWNLVIRYALFANALLLLYFGRKIISSWVTEPVLRNAWSMTGHTVILGLISAEYLHWTTVSGADNQYKLGLSILWGLYALFLIVYGISKKQKHLRLGAIILFCIILIKLFVYDLSEAGTITKTISFVSLGIILLLVSYLYNRYKEVLFGEEGSQKNDV